MRSNTYTICALKRHLKQNVFLPVLPKYITNRESETERGRPVIYGIERNKYIYVDRYVDR